MHVKLAGHSDGNARHFRDLVNTTKGILEAHALTGDFDYVLKICVRDLDGLRERVNGVLLQHKSVDRVRSEIVNATTFPRSLGERVIGALSKGPVDLCALRTPNTQVLER